MASITHADAETSAALEKIVARAEAHYAVPRHVTDAARAATLRRFEGEGCAVHPGRMEAYFWAVVRRRAFSGGARTAELRDRFLLAAQRA